MALVGGEIGERLLIGVDGEEDAAGGGKGREGLALDAEEAAVARVFGGDLGGLVADEFVPAGAEVELVGGAEAPVETTDRAAGFEAFEEGAGGLAELLGVAGDGGVDVEQWVAELVVEAPAVGKTEMAGN